MKAVLRIREILERIRIREILERIRIRGFVPLTNGFGSSYFRLRPSIRLLLIFQR
jgi:hypothetical protein